MIVVFLCKGTLGDVSPVFSIAQHLRATQPTIKCYFVTHSSHIPHFQHHADKHDIKLIPLDVPIKRKKFHIKDKECDRHERVKEMHMSKVACKEADKLIFNLFACEGWYIAQFMNIPCAAVSPFILTRSPPVSFENQLKEVYPELYAKLKTSKKGEVSYREIEHWMWRLFLDDFGQFCEDLQIPICPYLDSSSDFPLPPPTLLLYGLSSVIVERQPYWPKSVILCGYWFSDAIDSSYTQAYINTIPVHSPSSIKSTEISPHHTITLHEFITGCNDKPVYVGFGSMEDINCFDEVDCLRLLQVINKCVLHVLNRKVLFQTTESSPLFKAWQDLLAESQTDCIIHCITEFLPHSYLFTQMSTVIHHGGSGTVGMAIRSGVPQIVCPILFDQSYWGQKVEWLGIGICLGHPKSLHDEEFSQALRNVSSKDCLEKVKTYSETIKKENGIDIAVNELLKTFDITN